MFWIVLNTSSHKVDIKELPGANSNSHIDEVSVRNASIKYLATRVSLWIRQYWRTFRIKHLILLEEKTNDYFSTLTKNCRLDRVVIWFHRQIEFNLITNEKNKFIDIYSSSTTQILFNSKKENIDFFLFSLVSGYPVIMLFIKYLYKCFTANREII